MKDAGGLAASLPAEMFAAKEMHAVQLQSHAFIGSSLPKKRQLGSSGVWFARGSYVKDAAPSFCASEQHV